MRSDLAPALGWLCGVHGIHLCFDLRAGAQPAALRSRHPELLTDRMPNEPLRDSQRLALFLELVRWHLPTTESINEQFNGRHGHSLAPGDGSYKYLERKKIVSPSRADSSLTEDRGESRPK